MPIKKQYFTEKYFTKNAETEKREVEWFVRMVCDVGVKHGRRNFKDTNP
jgi:hypothetical protein